MAYEVTAWRKEGCAITLQVSALSRRERFSREINEAFGEGGGLNADYRTVEAIAVAASILGMNGMKYGEDFVFKTGNYDEISFDFRDEEAKGRAEAIFQAASARLY